MRFCYGGDKHHMLCPPNLYAETNTAPPVMGLEVGPLEGGD